MSEREKMISLYGETHTSSSFAMIFYTFICLPFLRISQAAIRICRFLVDPHHQPESSRNLDWELDLPVTLFGETAATSEGEMCSICLEEFTGEDSVNRLPKCGHLFHAGCMERWLDTCQFTCPLCRSSLLRRARPSPCISRAPPPFCIRHDHHYS